MRTKKIRWGNPLFVVFLAIAGIFGISSAVINKQAEEQPVVEKAEAVSAGDTIYLITNSNWRSAGCRFAAVFNDSSNVWVNMTLVDKVYYSDSGISNNEVYKVTIPSGQTKNVDFCRMNGSAATNNWNNKYDDTGFISFSSFTKNTAKITEDGWSNSYSINDSNIWCVTQIEVNDGTQGSTIKTQYVYSTYSYPVPTQPTKTGYKSEGWFTNSTCSSGYSSASTMSADTTLYAKYTKGDWHSHTIYYAHSDNSYSLYARVDRGENTGGNQWNSDTMSLTTRRYGSKYVYTGEVYEYWGSLYAMYLKNGNAGADSGAVIETVFTSETASSVFDNKLYDGSSWKTVYTVDFNMNGHGTEITGQFVASGGKVTQPTAPTATGYTFGGWYKEAECTNAWTFSTDTVTTNKILYAKWTANSYSITYKDQGNVAFSGTHATGYPTSHTYGTATTLKTASKGGYSFGGWFTTSACTGSAVTSLGATAYTAAIILYAKWIPDAATITFNKQSGSGGSDSVSATYGEAMPSAIMPTRSGYTFGGYFTETGGNGTKYYNANGSSAQNWDGTGDTTLYANWTANQYTVTLNNQSATTAGATSVSATFGAAVPSIAANLPAKTGYTFGGYFTETGGNGTKYINANGTSAQNWDIASDTILYAKWTINTYVITYDRNNNGDSSAKDTSTSKTHGVSYTILDPTTFEWTPSSFRRFIGWADSREGIATHFIGESYTTNAAKTFYYNEDWYNYRYKTDSDADWIDLIHNDTGLDTENNMVQFSPASSHVLTSGDKLSFQVSTDGKKTWSTLAVSTYSGSNNNYDTSSGVKLTTTDTIYLKITKAGVYDCWVPGITDYTVRVNGTDVYSMVGWGTSGGGKEQMKATALVYGQKDQILEIGNIGNYYRGYRNGGCTGIEERTVSGQTNLYFTITGMYTVYLIKEDGSHWDNIYVELDEQASAEKWGSEFMATVGCDATGNSLPSGWTACVNYYANLSDGTKNKIYAASGDVSGNTLQQGIARYDYAVSHHDSLTKFVKNSSGTARVVSAITHPFSPLSLFGEEQDLTSVIIIISSSIALVSITGLSVLVLKKRKTKEE